MIPPWSSIKGKLNNLNFFSSWTLSKWRCLTCLVVCLAWLLTKCDHHFREEFHFKEKKLWNPQEEDLNPIPFLSNLFGAFFLMFALSCTDILLTSLLKNDAWFYNFTMCYWPLLKGNMLESWNIFSQSLVTLMKS